MVTTDEDCFEDNQKLDFTKPKGRLELANSEEACRLAPILVQCIHPFYTDLPNKQDEESHIVRLTSIVNPALNTHPINQGKSMCTDRLEYYLWLL